MKKVTKVLLMLGVLMLPAGLWASHELFLTCVLTIPRLVGGPVVIMRDVRAEAVDALEAHGWTCEEPGPLQCPPGTTGTPPDCI